MNIPTPYQALQPGMSAAPPPAPPAPPSPREKIARFKTLSRRALQHWKVAAVIMVIGLGASLAAGMSVKLNYRSECTILFKPAIRTGERNDENQSERAQRVGAKLKDLLVTRTRLEAVIKQFKLYPQVVDSRGIVEAVDEMRLHIGFRARDSETFVLSFENDVPDLTRQVTESLADSMINEFANSNLSAAKQEVDFLAKQEERSGADFEKANKDLATFLTENPEFAVESKGSAFGPAPGGGGGGAAGAQPQPALQIVAMPKELSSGDPQLAVLYRQRSRLEAELRNDSEGAQAPTPVATGADAITTLTVQRDQAAKTAAAAAADLAQKRMRLTDEHPDVISAKLTADVAARQLHQAEMALAAAKAGGNGGANPYDATGDSSVQKHIAQLNAAIAARQDTLRHGQPQAPVVAAVAEAGAQGTATVTAGEAKVVLGETNELVQLETTWQRLLSVLQGARSEHDDLKQRLEHARLSQGATEAVGNDQMMIVDPAYKPLHPSKGGRSKTAMMGGAVTLILALAYAFARVLFSDTLIDSADIEALQVVPVLGVLPKVRPSTPPPGSTRAPSPPSVRQKGDTQRVG